MRAISILFLVMNVYYFCYPYFLSMNLNIGVVHGQDTANFQRDTGLFSHSLVSSPSVCSSFLLLHGSERTEGRGDVMKGIGCYLIAGMLLYVFGSELLLTARFPVALLTLLCSYRSCRIYQPAYRRNLDQPPVEETNSWMTSLTTRTRASCRSAG